jgi:hypothetical protein
MAHKNDYIPPKDSDFDAFFKNIVDTVDEKTGGNRPEWDHIPQDALQEFHDAWTAWTAAYEKTKVPHSPVETAEKNRVRKSSGKVLRNFINRFLRFAPVTPEERARMGIPEHDEIHTTIPRGTGQDGVHRPAMAERKRRCRPLQRDTECGYSVR